MSDKPILANERPKPVGEEVKPVNRVTKRKISRAVSDSRYSNVRKRRYGGTKFLRVRIGSGDYTRLKNTVDATPGLSMQDFCESAIVQALEIMEHKHGGTYRQSKKKRNTLFAASKHAVDFYV